jgi:hypothetical protein
MDGVVTELTHVQALAQEFTSAIESFCLQVGATDTTDLIDHVEAYIAQCEQSDYYSNHHFYPGLYSRETVIPGGTVFVTDIHTTEHPLFLMCGIITIWKEASEGVTLYAPCVLHNTPGTRRIIYAHTDVVGVTVHATDETDPEVIRRNVTLQRQNPHLISLS